MKSSELAVTASSLGNPPFRELLQAASGAGFAGLSIWPEATWVRAREDGWTDAGMRTALADHGLVVHDVDAVIVWAGDDDPGAPYIEESPEALVLRAAEALGARVCNVLVMGSAGVPEEAVTKALARTAERLNRNGLSVVVEFTRRTAVRDVETTARAVAGARSAGHDISVLLDVWHHRWSALGGRPLTAETAALVEQMQLNDAPAHDIPDVAWANRHDRYPPGDGACRVAGLVAAVRGANPGAAMVVEVFNDRLLSELGVSGMARRLARAGRSVVSGEA